LYSLLGGGGAFAVIYPTEEILCMDEIKSKKYLTSIEKAEKSLKVSNIKKDISDMDSKSSVWDHNYVQDDSVSTDDKIKIVLYGVLGSSSYCSIHSALATEAQRGSIRYTARHAHPGLTPVSQVLTFYFFVYMHACKYAMHLYICNT
jgi:hypothetical protein